MFPLPKLPLRRLGGAGAPPLGGVPLGHPNPTTRQPDGGPTYSGTMPSGVHAVFAVDPGGTTGVAAGHYELLGSMKKTMLEGRRMHKTAEVKGTWKQQGKAIAAMINKFLYTAQVEYAIPATAVHVVFENYLADPRRVGAGATNLDPVWVAAAACAYLDRDDLDLTWQTASQAKSYATNDRLRLWDLWVQGSEHMRDANRHLAWRVNQLVG